MASDIAKDAQMVRRSVSALWDQHTARIAKEPARALGGTVAFLSGVGAGALVSRRHAEKNLAGIPLGAGVGGIVVAGGLTGMIVGGETFAPVAPFLPYAIQFGAGMIGDWVSHHVRTDPSFDPAPPAADPTSAGY